MTLPLADAMRDALALVLLVAAPVLLIGLGVSLIISLLLPSPSGLFFGFALFFITMGSLRSLLL